MLTSQALANAIRILSMDAVQKANSGHPGMPMGMADIAQVLWHEFLHHNPANPQWPNRDRLIISNGHGSMLLYAILHLTGYDVSIEDLKQFRQLHSKTPGHPEKDYTPGVETTTGPLGQGLANAVGMAIAEKSLAAQFNRSNFPIIDHYTYVFLGDGCLMEGISHEVCSFAGTLGLGKLIAFWDDNGISIDGQVTGWFTDDTPKRFEAYGWHVVRNVDGHNPKAIKNAIIEAQKATEKPSLIACKTTIAYGSPNLAGSHDAHGSALGEAEVAATRENLGWTFPPFVIPTEIYTAWNAKEAGKKIEADWNTLFNGYKTAFPDLAKELLRRMSGELPTNWQEKTTAFIKKTQEKGEGVATRKASQNTLNYFGPLLPELLGGSADLTGSNLTLWKGSKTLDQSSPEGNYLYYGVREFGMSAIMNGIALYGGFIPYGGTFLTFVDYARNAVRMAALMKQRVIFIYTHDSIGLGEDGPTHQPIEHISMLRLTPGLFVWRPCDAVESAVAWKFAIEQQHAPTCLLFSRQTLAHQHREETALTNIQRGGYVLLDSQETPEVILIATGSEVDLAVKAATALNEKGHRIRVVSMPSTDVFALQPIAYQNTVLPPSVTCRIAIEAGSTDFWYKYVGLGGKVIGLDHYGESAPAPELFKIFGFTTENVISTVLNLLEKSHDNSRSN
jgi:transketolase